MCAAIAGCSSGGSGAGTTAGVTDGLTVDSTGSGVFTIVGPEGGPFPQGARDYVLANRGTETVEWEVEASADWLLVFSQDDGILNPLESTRVTISIDHQVAEGLPRGEYPSDIVFRNAAGDVQVVFAFQLTVKALTPGEIAVTPDDPFEPSGEVGSPVTPAQRRYVVENIGTDELDYVVTASEPWLELTGAFHGTLSPGEEADVFVVVDDSVTGSMAAGQYATEVIFENTTNGLGSTEREVILTLTAPGDDGRVTQGLVALYEFGETSGDMIFDTSGISPNLDLHVSDSSAIARGPGALSIVSPTIVESVTAADKLIAACQSTNEVTIEAWVRPANTTQSGPARIVNLADPNSAAANFMLGQGRWGSQPSDVFTVRLKTTDQDGEPALTSPSGSATTGLTHVVYTRRASGQAEIYVDGVSEAQTTVTGSFATWGQGFRLVLANELGSSRPWIGDLHLVALYGRALSPDEIQQNFAAGAGDPLVGQLNINPNGGFSVVGAENSDFSGFAKTYTLHNVGTAPIDWSATVSEPWIRLQGQAMGTLAPDQTKQLTIALDNNQVTGFQAGSYTGRLEIVNETNGFGSAGRDVNLTITSGGGSGSGSNGQWEKPGPSNTGPLTPNNLVNYSGPPVIDQDGTVIQGVRFTSTITIQAANVTIRNFSLDANGASYGINCNNGAPNLVLEDGEILDSKSAAIMGGNVTARRLEIHHHGSDGLKIRENSLVESCWIHHLGQDDGSHADGDQTRGGSNIVFRANFFDVPVPGSPGHDGGNHKSNACILINPKLYPSHNIIAEYNWFNGGHYTYQLRDADGTEHPTGCKLINNRFGRDYTYGVLINRVGNDLVISGNVWDDTDQLMSINNQ